METRETHPENSKLVYLAQLQKYHSNMKTLLDNRGVSYDLSTINSDGAEYTTIDSVTALKVTYPFSSVMLNKTYVVPTEVLDIYFGDTKVCHLHSIKGSKIRFVHGGSGSDFHIYTDKEAVTLFFDNDNNYVGYQKSKYSDIANVLTKANSVEYTPTADYNPATKKYVDDKIGPVTDYVDDRIFDEASIKNITSLRKYGITVEEDRTSSTIGFFSYNVTFDPVTIKTYLSTKTPKSAKTYFAVKQDDCNHVKFFYNFATGTKKHNYIYQSGLGAHSWNGLYSLYMYLTDEGKLTVMVGTIDSIYTEVFDNDNNRLESECLDFRRPNSTNTLMTDSNVNANFVPAEDWQPTNKKYVDNAITSALQVATTADIDALFTVASE